MDALLVARMWPHGRTFGRMDVTSMDALLVARM